jgi:hypothetical protein
MTEEEWLACEEPMPMLAALRSRASDRQLLLFCVAGFYLARSYDPDDGTRLLNEPTIESVARFADGLAGSEEMRSVWRARGFPPTVAGPEHPFEWAASFLERAGREDVLHRPHRGYPRSREFVPALHDIFGNPFRPAAFSPEWRTDTAVALARQMYESRDFGAMPILADALQDAGCDSEEILSHCRDASAKHVRGCWMVDALLGKV